MTDELDPPVVTVALSTYNRAARLQIVLDAIEEQDVDGVVEVCVCDDGSTDDTPAVLAAWAARTRHRARTVRNQPNRGPAAGRNAAWRLATGERVVFTDDDTRPSRSWLRGHLAAGADGGVVVGRTTPPPGAQHVHAPLARTLEVLDARYFQTCNTSYALRDLVASGGFDESFPHAAGEDTDLGLRVAESGVPVHFADDALVHHDVRPPSLRATLRETGRWSTVVLVVRKHPRVRDELMHRRWFWKPTHPTAVLALIGLALAVRRPAALALLLPWLRLRGWRRPPGEIAALFVVDATEVAAMVRGSVRYRTLVL